MARHRPAVVALLASALLAAPVAAGRALGDVDMDDDGGGKMPAIERKLAAVDLSHLIEGDDSGLEHLRIASRALVKDPGRLPPKRLAGTPGVAPYASMPTADDAHDAAWLQPRRAQARVARPERSPRKDPPSRPKATSGGFVPPDGRPRAGFSQAAAMAQAQAQAQRTRRRMGNTDARRAIAQQGAASAAAAGPPKGSKDLSTVYEITEDETVTLSGRLDELANLFAKFDYVPNQRLLGAIYVSMVQLSKDLLKNSGVCPEGGIVEEFAKRVRNNRHRAAFASAYNKLVHETQQELEDHLRTIQNPPPLKVRSAIDGLRCLHRIGRALARIAAWAAP